MASTRSKDRTWKSIASNLPPSTIAFYQHCLRASRQIKIWLDSLDSHPTPPSMLISGYEKTYNNNKFTIKGTVLSGRPNDFRLDTCGDCKSNCTRCKCFNNNLSCTFYCKCNEVRCSNRVCVSWHSSLLAQFPLLICSLFKLQIYRLLIEAIKKVSMILNQ